ncbi:MAG: SDR family oxidoreductase, partial [Gammaproteobacteria bacterium]
IDVIYHSGALVNFVYTYEQLQETNVEGTQEVIHLATTEFLKPIHYVSTVAVFTQKNHKELTEINEHTSIDQPGLLLGGYAQTKWVSEQLMQQAKAQGLPITIYRPGRISGDTSSFILNKEDLFARSIIGNINLGAMPEAKIGIDLTPVDYVSKAIVSLSLNKTAQDKTFHLLHNNRLISNEFSAVLSDLDYPVALIEYKEWRNRLIQAALNLENNPLLPLLPLFAEDALEEQKEINRQVIAPGQAPFSCMETLKLIPEDIKQILIEPKELLAFYIKQLHKEGLIQQKIISKGN